MSGAPGRGLLRGAWAAGILAGAAASWARWALTGSLRVDARVRWWWGALIVTALGLGLSALAGARLARDAAGPPRRRDLATAVAVAALAALALPLTSSDLFAHLAYGRLHLHGLNSYLVGPIALDEPVRELVFEGWRALPNIYGPVTTLVLWGCAALGGLTPWPLVAGAAAIKLAMLACTLGVVAIAWRRARARPEDEAAGRAFLLLAFSPLLAWELAAQGHNDAVMVLAVAAFLHLADRGRDVEAAVALSLAVWSKTTTAPLLGLWLIVQARRSVPRAAALALVPLAVGLAAWAPLWAGPRTLQGTATFLSAGTIREANALVSLVVSNLRDPAGPAALLAYRASLALSTALPLGWLAWAAWDTWRRPDLARAARAWAVMLLLWYVTVPWFQAWYVAWMLPVLLVERDARWQAFLAAFAAAEAVQWAFPRAGYLTNPLLVAWVAWTLWRRLSPAPTAAAGRA